MHKIVALFALSLVAACGAPPTPAEQQDPQYFNFSCFQSCTSDSNCPSNERCWNGQCRIRPEKTFCVNSSTSGNQAGDRVACNAYLCDPSTGTCKRNCTTSYDCAGGYLCDTGKGRCVTPQDGMAPSDTPLPAVAPTVESDSLGAWCTKSCSVDTDCGDTFNYQCHNGKCLPFAPHCTNDHTAVWWDHSPYACNPYECNAVRGDCAWDCQSSYECSYGYACDPLSYSCISGY